MRPAQRTCQEHQYAEGTWEQWGSSRRHPRHDGSMHQGSYRFITSSDTFRTFRQTYPEFKDEDFVNAAMCLGLTEVISMVAPACWQTAVLLMHQSSARLQVIGYALALEALLQTPGAIEPVLEYLS